MNNPIYIYDTLNNDNESTSRGIGRYIRSLQEALANDIAITSDVSSLPYESTLLVPYFDFLKKPITYTRKSRKQVAIVHDMIPFQFPNHFPIGMKASLFAKLNMFLLKYNFDLVITDSNQSKETIQKITKIDRSKIKVVYPYLSNELPKLNYYTKEFSSLLYVGDITWNKNIEHILSATIKSGFHCKFVGKHFTQEKILSMSKKKLSQVHPWQYPFVKFAKIAVNNLDKIELCGFVSNDMLSKLYSSSSLNLLLSYEEGFGYSFLEASSFGTISLLSDIPIFHEIAQDSAFFSDPSNPKEIALKIEHILSDYSLIREFSEKAVKRAEYFSKERFTNKFIEIIRSIQ